MLFYFVSRASYLYAMPLPEETLMNIVIKLI